MKDWKEEDEVRISRVRGTRVNVPVGAREENNGPGSLETADSAVPMGPGPRVL